MRTNKHLFTGVAAEMGLTPGDLHALLSLDADEPRPMRAMAEEWRCDASNVTWMVDRLEAHGYVERQSLPNDRRVRTVALTAAGIDAQARSKGLLYLAPESFSKLSTDTSRSSSGSSAASPTKRAADPARIPLPNRAQRYRRGHGAGAGEQLGIAAEFGIGEPAVGPPPGAVQVPSPLGPGVACRGCPLGRCVRGRRADRIRRVPRTRLL